MSARPFLVERTPALDEVESPAARARRRRRRVHVAQDDVAGDAESAIAEVSELLAGSTAVEEGRVIAAGNSEISASGVMLVDLVERLAAGLPGE